MEWVRKRSESVAARFDTDEAWARFQRDRGIMSVPSRPSRRIVPWRIAAAIIVAAGLVYLRWPKTAALAERVAANGERPVITLDDGTRITLNGGSRLRYPATSSGDRDLYLEGEAFFEVTHDPQRELRVHAANGVVRDIGTKFTVRAYSGQTGVRVAVLEGSVELSPDKSAAPAVTLMAGDVGAIDSAGAPSKLRVLVDRYAGWTSGELVFDSIPLRDAVLDLEHRYGVRVVVADSGLAAKPVVARFHGETLPQVLDALSLALGARFAQTGSTYTMTRSAK